jgi:hypothetical protein
MDILRPDAVPLFSEVAVVEMLGWPKENPDPLRAVAIATWIYTLGDCSWPNISGEAAIS